RALPPGGMLLTMAMDPERAREARGNFTRAGLADRVTVIVGDAERMIAEVAGPFDLIFQDGDKYLYVPLLDRLVSLLRPGGLLVTDNVLWDGEVVPGFVRKPARDPADTRAIAEYNERTAAHPALVTAIVPLRARDTSAEEITERCLQRIEADNARLNAFILVMADQARQQAQALDRELAAGRERGPLHGVPVSIKDLLDVRGTPTTAASRVRDGHVAEHDAPAIA